MSLYEERLERDLKRLNKRLNRMAKSVFTALDNSVKSVLEFDPDLATETVLGDMPINRQARNIDHRCHLFVARHLPSAKHLRRITSVIRIAHTLERIGDYAETISREHHQIEPPIPEVLSRDISLLHERARTILDGAFEALELGDENAARSIITQAKQYGVVFDKIFADLRGETSGDNVTERKAMGMFALLTVCNRLERCIHQGKNICQQIIFTETGEQKESKTFDIVFLGNDNDGLSLLAEHYCKKAYPEAGNFYSVGWHPPDSSVPRDVLALASSNNIDLQGALPRTFDSIQSTLADFDIIIDLTGKAKTHIRKIPYHTSMLVWNIKDGGGIGDTFERLKLHLSELMEILRGDEGDEE